MNWRYLPNALTLLRIGLVPIVYLSIADGHSRQALGLLVIAALTDALDGSLARRYGWQTRFGGLLDPIADKLLLNASFLGLWSYGALPGWMLALVLGRDLLIVSGAVAYQVLVQPVPAQPSLLGKLATLLQVLLASMLLLELELIDWPSHWTTMAIWTVALASVLSGADYVVRWSRRAWQETHR